MRSALCITVTHEDIAFIAADPGLDGKGFLAAELFDTPLPDKLPDGGKAASIGGVKLRPQGAMLDGGGAELALDVATNAPLRFDNITQTVVYARVFFIDNPNAATQPGAGTWLGGYDLNGGLVKDIELDPITLTKGQGTAITINLQALRRFKVAVSRNASAVPLGDGQGSLTAVAASNHTLSGNGKGVVMGAASSDCKDLSGTTPVEITRRPSWDPARTGWPRCSMTWERPAISPRVAPLHRRAERDHSIPDANEITYPANAYQVSASIELIAVAPAGDAGTADNLSCGPGGDAGTDASDGG